MAPLPMRTGARAAVAAELLQLDLVGARHAVERVEVGDVGAAAAEADAHQPGEEGVGLVDHAHLEEGVQREGGVAQPGEAVVPVALATDLLGKAGGRRRDDGAGGRVGHQLQRQRRAHHRLLVRALVGAAVDPAPPELLRGAGEVAGVLDAPRRARAAARARRSLRRPRAITSPARIAPLRRGAAAVGTVDCRQTWSVGGVGVQPPAARRRTGVATRRVVRAPA